jgi:hypothetical protein
MLHIIKTNMKKLLSSVLLLFAFSASAQWTLTEVPGKDKTPVGYIYHTAATGTRIAEKSEKAFASLRIVCSTKSDALPMMVLYWNGMNGTGNRYPLVQADGKQVLLQQEVWIQENNILYRAIHDNDQLMKSLKSATRISFSWDDGTARYVVGFDAKGIHSGLGDFNTVCKTQI